MKRGIKMNNEIKVFENAEFGSVRTIDLNGVIYFVGKDVAEALGYSVPQKAVRDHIDDEDVLKWNTLTTQGIQKMLLINESGVYSLIFGSKLPEAKKFKHWVTNEVLPSIRKTGGYNVDQSYQQLADRVERLEKMISQQPKHKEIQTQPPQYRRSRNYQSKIAKLPIEIRVTIEYMLLDNQYIYDDIIEYLSNAYDIKVGKATLSRYYQKLIKS